MNNSELLDWWNSIDYEIQIEWTNQYFKTKDFDKLKLSDVRVIYQIVNGFKF